MEDTGSQTLPTENRSTGSRGAGYAPVSIGSIRAAITFPKSTSPVWRRCWTPSSMTAARLTPNGHGGRRHPDPHHGRSDDRPYLVSLVEWPRPEYIAALLSSMVMVASLPMRREHPLLMMTLVAIGAAIQFFFVPFPVLSIFVVPIASYSVARWVDGHQSRWVLWVGAVGSVIGPMRWIPTIAAGYDPSSGTPWVLLVLAMTVCAGLVLTPYAVGRRLRESALIDSQQRIVKAQRYRAILAEREQQARVAEERTRNEIARELHDIVAHSLSVMIVQAEGGKALATKKPEKAPEVLETIAETGREALLEMRRIVGVLRQDTDAEFSPPLAWLKFPTWWTSPG